jgi:type IV secretory pathway VirB2 component (pilin)
VPEGVLGSEVNDMRESLQRRCRPWRYVRLTETNTDDSAIEAQCANGARVACRFGLAVVTAVLVGPVVLHAQSPWERAAANLEQTFTGPLARSLALVAIVIGGLMFMFGEGGAKRQISGIVFGGGLALFAAQFLAWLF